MTAFECDDREVERLLARLEGQVTALGARIHRDARIRCEGGSLSVLTSAPADPSKPLILLPERCLLPTAGLAFRVAGDRLEAA
ncbi:MAG TPA: hypothetical protein ENO23_05160, partial [Alphaproteobacteria bacterium]|nr:hypothetical protein [Alphaproteobacteria bacterium]